MRKNTPLTLVSITLSQPTSGNSSSGAPHDAPALFTSTSSCDSAPSKVLTNELIPSSCDRSAGIETHVPPYSLLNRSAVASR